MRDTNNRGVDAVLNSLAGKHQQLGVQALAPGGRFLEIGKLVRSPTQSCLWCIDSLAAHNP